MKKAIILLLLVTAMQSCKKCATFYYESTTTQHFAPHKTINKEWTEDHCGDDYKEKKDQKDMYYPYNGDILVYIDSIPCDVHVRLIKYK